MNYQAGSASSTTDLVQQMVTWLVGLGWTQDRSAAEGSGWTATLHKSGNFVNLRAAMNESTIWHANAGSAHYGVHMYLSTAYASGQPFNNQTTGSPLGSSTFPVGVGMQLTAGPFANYYFFADASADNIVVVVERVSGFYVHIGWGLSIVKAGSFTGGPYFFGSTSGYYTSFTSAGAGTPGMTATADCPLVPLDGIAGGTGFVRADVDSFTGKWVGIDNASGADQGATSTPGDSSVRGTFTTMKRNFPVYAYSSSAFEFEQQQVSAQDGRANLLPIILWARRDGTTTGFSMLGTVPNVVCTNAVGNGFANADEYSLGSDTWKIFPNFAVLKQ